MEEKKKELAEKRKLKDKAKEALQALEGGIGSSDGTATETSIGTENDNNNNNNKENKLPPPTAETATITAAEATISNDGSVSSNKAVVGDSKQESKETVLAEPTTTAAATQKPTTGDQPNKIKNEIQNQNKNKKRAKIDAETGLECVDIHENCPFWAATGDCKTNRGFMSINCRLSCDRCHIVRVNNNNDIHSYINRKAKETEKEREAQKQERVVRKILQGEL